MGPSRAHGPSAGPAEANGLPEAHGLPKVHGSRGYCTPLSAALSLRTGYFKLALLRHTYFKSTCVWVDENTALNGFKTLPNHGFNLFSFRITFPKSNLS